MACQQFGMSPAQTVGIAGAVPYAGAPSGVGTRSRHAASTKASHKSPSVAENGVRIRRINCDRTVR